jgi:hypothetical protein
MPKFGIERMLESWILLDQANAKMDRAANVKMDIVIDQ